MTKKALLVGINAYGGGNGLSGCVNDAEDLYALLTGPFGFPPDNVRMLLDARATREAVLSRLEWLVRGAAPGDELVFAFSGHGTQIRDWSGDELEDHLDECLVPVDYDWLDASLIKDDDLLERFLLLPANLTVILDCCHSGSATRSLAPMLPRQPRYLAPPRDVAARARGRALESWKMLEVAEGMTHLLIAACQSSQVAADAYFNAPEGPELEPRPNGALTYFLARALREPATTWLQVMETAKAGLAGDLFEQVPRLEGPAARINGYPFGGR